MKTVGIKLADGSFYPIMEDGAPQQIKLDLTTAHNNQTCVMVDLYRSATGTMEDAEYIDTLKIENLVAHPNGEPSLSFSVGIDEDGELSAQIEDPETGFKSNPSISRINRTIEERLSQNDFSDYTIETADPTEPLIDEVAVSDDEVAFEEPVAEEETEEKSSKAGVIAGVAAGAGLMAMAAALNKKSKDEEPVAETEFEEVDLSDMDYKDDQVINEFGMPVPASEVNDTASEPVSFDNDDFTIPEDASADDSLGLADMDFDIPEDASSDTATDVSTDLPDMDFDVPADTVVDDATIESSDLPDMDFDIPEDTGSDTATDVSTDLPDMDFDTDDFADLNTDSASDETVAFDNDDFSIPETTDSDISTGLDDMDFNIPDDTTEDVGFGNTPVQDDFNVDNFMANDLDLPDFTEQDNFAADTGLDDDLFADTSNNQSNNMFDDNDSAAMAGSGGLSFTGLYDKETEMGDSSVNTDDDIKKKTKAPVIICVICALICLIATALLLFIIPSKYNLITKNKKDTTEVVETPAPVEETVETPAPVIEEEKPVIPVAEEDTVIIIEEAEEVVPLPPPVVETKPKDITYKIKWGDTLWDIADTYYKNPWRYKKIAAYNKIKNPDYIISGTTILIPAE